MTPPAWASVTAHGPAVRGLILEASVTAHGPAVRGLILEVS